MSYETINRMCLSASRYQLDYLIVDDLEICVRVKGFEGWSKGNNLQDQCLVSGP